MCLTFDWCLHSPEIDEVMKMLHHFGAYNRAVAQGGAQSARQGPEQSARKFTNQETHFHRQNKLGLLPAFQFRNAQVHVPLLVSSAFTIWSVVYGAAVGDIVHGAAPQAPVAHRNIVM